MKKIILILAFPLFIVNSSFTGQAGMAKKALGFERRLELANEGHRRYDLVHWGTPAQVMNAYFASEGRKRVLLSK